MDDLTCVKMVLRSLLLSFKDGCKLHSLPGAYRELDGNFIPFKQFGYSSLLQFLQHIPDVARLGRNREGEDVVHGVANEETAHIQKMVQRQKSKKSKPRPGSKFRGRPFRPNVAPQQMRAPPRGPRGPGPHSYPGSYGGFAPRPNFLGGRPPIHGAPRWPYSPRSTITVTRPNPNTPGFANLSRIVVQALQPGHGQRGPRQVPPPNRMAAPSKTFSNNRPPQRQQNQNPIVLYKNRPEFQIEPAQLPSPGESVGVTVSYIQDAHNIFVTLDRSAVHSMMMRIQRRTTVETAEALAAGSPDDMVDAFCLARYSKDNYWYRAQITNVHVNYRPPFDTVYQVQFVDFGNSEKRPSNDLRPITAEECALRAHSVKCSLYAILPKSVSWSSECNMELQRLLDGQIVNMTVGRIIADEICEVTLMVQGTNVNEHLVSRGLARKKNLEPVHLEPPAEEFPMVYVSYFERTTAVVVRYMGEEYSEALESLENRMLEVYRHTQYNADEFAINVGGVYATMNQDDEGVSVCRVRVLECRENRVGRRVVNCYLPDHGDTETIDVTRLRWLRDEFRLLPYQAVTFNLQGLEPYSSNRLVLELMVQEMLAMEFAVEYDTNDGTGKTVTLHDAESNRNMNEWLLAQLPDGALSQQLAEPDSTYESDAITVKVLNIRENGIVSVRIPGEGERRYSVLERDLQEEIDKKRYEPLPWDSVRRGERVVAQYVEDDGTATWYRAKIIGVADEQIEVEFVDYGNVSPVLRTQIHSLRQLELGQRLNSLPIQRNDVRLTGLPPSGGEWTPQALDTLGVILDPDEKFELRVDKVTESGVAEVSLYGYTEEKQLFCVNEHLLSEVEELFMPEPSVPTPPQSQSSSQQELGEVGVTPDLVRSAEQIQPVAHSEEVRVVRKQSPAVDENTEALKRLTLELKYYHTRPLPCTVPIVDVGSFMPVHVPWADNPGNFACIPMSSFNDLSDLLENMNDFYRKFPQISIQIVPGHMYAAKFEQQWYRVIIKDLFPDNQKVSAQFVDFGDFHLLSYGDLQPLDGAYQSIPRMAFKARLGGLAPELGIWDRVTCTRLQSLVIDKSLHCLVLDKQHVEDGVVSVDLVRTDSGHDVCITDALIQEGLARPDAVLRG